MWRGLTALFLGLVLNCTASLALAQQVPCFPSADEKAICTSRLTSAAAPHPKIELVKKPKAGGDCSFTCTATGPNCVCRLNPPNLRPAVVLSQLDIDGDGVPDNSPDSDGDGLPDNWELGGADKEAGKDMVVYFPAPSAIVPGTPPTPIFARRAVATDAYNADTDGDGLTDFIEVFGLMFIDDNHNGILDPEEWYEGSNPNGLPNPGEYPLDQSPAPGATSTLQDIQGQFLRHDFDGFIFTDPTNPDTDGDGIPDGEDRDPLINPKSFGLTDAIVVRFEAAGDPDIDKDGLGNASDMGNDLTKADAPGLGQWQIIDNPANLPRVLKLFRPDLLKQGIVPESTIEDLLGADWDGNGLWRTTDVREWHLVIDDSAIGTTPPAEFFRIDPDKPTTNLYRTQTFDDLAVLFNDSGFARYGGHISGQGIGLGWQELLKPSSRDQFPQFMPDVRIWAILYAWRMPGFDIDGDGFVGAPNITSTAANAANPELASVALTRATETQPFQLSDRVFLSSKVDEPFDDRIPIGDSEVQPPQLNGTIEVPQLARLLRSVGCGAAMLFPLAALVTALCFVKLVRRRGR